MQAIFIKGNPVLVDYTPSGAVSSGDVIIDNDRVLIAHQDIAAGALGTVAIGGGVYDFAATTADTVDFGDDLFWNDSTNVAEEDDSGNTYLGPCVRDKANGDTKIRAFHAYPGLAAS